MTESYTAEVTIPDLLESPGNGLLDNVTWIPAENVHWQGGIQYDADCYQSSHTISACFDGGPAEIAAKAETWSHMTRGARPFTVYDRWDCAPVGRGLTMSDLEVGRESALRALTASAPFTAERVFWTGDVGNTPAKVYPNLVTIGTSPIVTGHRGLITLQPVGTNITGTLDVTEGLGRLEESIAECYHGQAWIHVPAILLPSLSAKNLVYVRNNRLVTYAGNRVIVGRGYDSSVGINGVANAAGVTQMIATSPVFGLKSTPRAFDVTSSFDRNVNTMEHIAEQTYVLSWHCCLIAVTVTTGGEEAGLFADDSAAT